MATLSSKPSAQVLVETDGALAYVTLNRPEKRNALSLHMMEELTSALGKLAQDAVVQVVVIKAKGPVFSAGHDLNELVERDEAAYRHIFETCVNLMERIKTIPQPVIASVHAPATAAGCQLVASCDLAVAADSAWFATPGVKIGLFCSTPMVAVSRCIGQKLAMQMLLTGDAISAHQALAAGLVNSVVPVDKLDDAVLELARKIAAQSPAVVEIGKAAFYKQLEMTERDAYAYAKEVMTINAEMADAHEGITAFLQKRAPRWSNTGEKNSRS